MRKKGVLLVLLLISAILSLGLGKFGLNLSDYAAYFGSFFGGQRPQNYEIIDVLINQVRLPRVIACVIIGASLAISGAAYQAMFVNPLVSPSILGVLSGAAFGAGLGMYFGLGEFFNQLCTFGFGLVAVIFAVLIAGLNSRSNLVILILGGVISSSLFGALLSILKYAADPNDVLPAITYFLMGSLSFASKNLTFLSVLPMLAGILILSFSGKYLNALSMGQEEASSLGIDVQKVKFIVIAVATLISSLSVILAGIIGWIGLIIPHIARLTFGADNRTLLGVSAMMGAIFLLLCDSFSRLVFTYEIPIGIVTSLFGIPVFVVVLFKTKKNI